MAARKREPIWQIQPSLAHFKHMESDYAYDLAAGSPSGLENPASVSGIGRVYTGYPPNFAGSDFPVTKGGALVVSRRMLEVLEGAGAFPHTIVPVEITDYPIQLKAWCDEVGPQRAREVLHGYVELEDLAPHADEEAPAGSYFQPPVLLALRGAREVLYFVNDRGRSALTAAGITGVDFS